MTLGSFIPTLAALLLSPLLLGIINKTKAFYAGRKGPPLLQTYFDLRKLLGKGAVYSVTTTWVFRAGPVVGLASVLLAASLVPLGSRHALFGFEGDLVMFAYLLGLMRFFTVIAALDTGSSFEGMGASREVQFSALAEPALFMGLAALAGKSGSFSLTGIFAAMGPSTWVQAGPMVALVLLSFFVVFLAENARIPVDDPNTHLELTMIHEVMVLDHGGPDFAFITYGAAMKMWILGALLVELAVPVRTGNPWADMAAALLGMAVLGVVVGTVESSMARLRLLRVPQLLVGAGALSALAFIVGLI